MKASTIVTLTIAAALPTTARFASADFDFSPYVTTSDGVSKIGVGGHDDEEGNDVAVLRTSQFGFGENPEDPYNITDPGFNTNGASGFAHGSTLYLTGKPVDGVSLRYWDGSGSTPHFDAAPVGVTLMLSKSPAVNTTFSAAGETYSINAGGRVFVGNFANDNGALHEHLQSALFYGGQQANDTVPVGDYLISFVLTNPNGVAASDTEFALFNNGLTDEQTDAAVDYVNATYVPEPASLGMAVVYGLTLLRRRRTV